MLGRLEQWNSWQCFSSIRADWLARSACVGENVRVRLAEHELAGRFEALDEAGGLVLGLPDGSGMTIAAGDAVLDPAPVSVKATSSGIASMRAYDGLVLAPPRRASGIFTDHQRYSVV